MEDIIGSRPLNMLTLDIIETYTKVCNSVESNLLKVAEKPNKDGYLQLLLNKLYLNEFTVTQLLCRGSSSTVYRIQNQNTDQYFVIKISRAKELYHMQLTSECAIYELLASYDYDLSPKVIKVVTLFEQRAIIFQNFDITLQQLIALNNTGLPLQYIKVIAFKLLQHINVLRQLGIVHNDLNLQNIVLNLNNIADVRIIDYGNAFFYKQGCKYGKVKLIHRSPEQLFNLNRNQWDSRIDYFALGSILFELHTGRPLFMAQDEFQLVKQYYQILGDLGVLFNPEFPQVKENDIYFTSAYNNRSFFLQYQERLQLVGWEDGWHLYPSAYVLQQFSIYDQAVQEFKLVGTKLLKKLCINKYCYTLKNHQNLDYEKFGNFLERLLTIQVKDRGTYLDLQNHPFLQ